MDLAQVRFIDGLIEIGDETTVLRMSTSDALRLASRIFTTAVIAVDDPVALVAQLVDRIVESGRPAPSHRDTDLAITAAGLLLRTLGGDVPARPAWQTRAPKPAASRGVRTARTDQG